jgi:hypothetical protein
MPERIDQIERDVMAHAKTISEFTRTLIEIEKRDAVEQEAKKHLDERLDRIEGSIRALHSLGKWILAAFGSGIVGAFVTFIVNGGFRIG